LEDARGTMCGHETDAFIEEIHPDAHALFQGHASEEAEHTIATRVMSKPCDEYPYIVSQRFKMIYRK
jgi:hypothetical protein